MYKTLRFLSLSIILTVYLACTTNTVYAQNGKIIGKVTDSSTGEPLPGASILIQGTQRGTLSDIEGNYQLLQVPIGQYKITVSYILYCCLS